MEATRIIDRTNLQPAIDQLEHLARHLRDQAATYTPVEVITLVLTIHSLSSLVTCMDALKLE